MAYTKIIVIRGRLDKCLRYAANEEKTYLETAVDYALDRDKTERVCFETADGKVSPACGSVSRRAAPVKAGRLPCISHPRAAQCAHWTGLDRSRPAAFVAGKGETIPIRAERG